VPETAHADYLKVLRDMTVEMEKLCSTSRRKTAAVKQDDLKQLADILKEEQVISLSLRSLEHRQIKLQQQLGIEQVPLRDLHHNYPETMRADAKQTAERLREQYRQYRSSAEVARNTLECNLHEIEKILQQTPGYAPEADFVPPAGLRTDFRA